MAADYNKFCYSAHIDSVFTIAERAPKFMQPKASSWIEARENCRALGGDLVSISNELELNFIALFQCCSYAN